MSKHLRKINVSKMRDQLRRSFTLNVCRATGGITEVSVDFLEREFDGQTTERESRIMR